MAGKSGAKLNNAGDAVYSDKPNSRVTRKHLEALLEAMDFATDNATDGYQRLGYLSFAVTNVLKEVGYPKHHEVISKRMWANYGQQMPLEPK